MLQSLISKFVSYPRNQYTHDGHDLDLAIITDKIAVMSLPATTFPQTLYRNQLHKVKEFLDSRYIQDSKPQWKVFEFRAEGAGYEDSAFEGKVAHFPFPDHHPPPFALLPRIVDAMHEHLSQAGVPLAVLHCKAGKGRSGLATCSYLVAWAGWDEADARRLFTEKRMRPGFGEGVSIPSQQRYLTYVQKWTKAGKQPYTNANVTLERLEVVGLQRGYTIAVRRFEEDGKTIRTLHEFSKAAEISVTESVTTLTPDSPLIVPKDVCIYVSTGTAWAHFWFNTSFEGPGHFRIDWCDVDGWKGTRLRANQAYDSIAVHWT